MNAKIRKIMLISIFIPLLICTIISISYAFYVVEAPDDTYEISTMVDIPACANISVEDEKEILISGDYAIPIMDSRLLNSGEQVLNNYKYTFTVSNGCASAADFTISLAPLLSSTMPIGAIKYALVESGEDLPEQGYYVNSGSNQKLLTKQIIDEIKMQNDYDIKMGYELLSTSLSVGQSKTYNLYLWIDYYEGDRNEGRSKNNTTMDKSFSSVLVISNYLKGVNTSSQDYPSEWNDNGVFSDYYALAYQKLNTMTTSEKVGQLLIMSYSNDNPSTANDAVQNYHVGGALFFANAFKGKTEAQVKTMISDLQAKAKIPLMTAVDEEGGTVVRVSSNTNLASAKFKSPQALYAINGFNTIREDTITKSALLKKLGLNVNFAPVVDIADPGNFIYSRTLGQGPQETATYARTVIEASKGGGVSYSLKHFPGYGNNADTHISSSVDETSLEELWNKHLVPFIAGIDSGAEAVMISHNIVSAIDEDYPSSLSKPVHDLLFNDLNFTGIAFTDDLYMEAIGNNYSQQYLKAFKAGNHVLLTSSAYATAHGEILQAYNSGEITQEELDKRVFKVLAWKYYIGILK